MERTLSESCGPARGDEGMVDQDKVVFVSRRWSMFCRSCGNGIQQRRRSHAHMIGRQQYARQVRSFPECCCFVADQFQHLLFVCFDGRPKAKIADFRMFSVLIQVETRCYHEMLMVRNKTWCSMSFVSLAPTIIHWAPLSRTTTTTKRTTATFLCLQTCPRVHNTYLRCTSTFCEVSERRTIHVPRDGPFGGIGIRSSPGCTSSAKSASRSHVHCSSSGRRCMNVASRGGLKYSSPRMLSWTSATNPDLRCSVLVSIVPDTFRCLLFLIRCCSRFRSHFCVWAGGPARGDVQDVSIHSSFQWVCRLCSCTV